MRGAVSREIKASSQLFKPKAKALLTPKCVDAEVAAGVAAGDALDRLRGGSKSTASVIIFSRLLFVSTQNVILDRFSEILLP